MFTRNQSPLLVAVAVVAASVLSGCEKGADPDEFGEVVNEVPPELNKPFPLPELERPEKEPPSAKPPANEPAAPESQPEDASGQEIAK